MKNVYFFLIVALFFLVNAASCNKNTHYAFFTTPQIQLHPFATPLPVR